MQTRDRILMVAGLWIAVSPFLVVAFTLYMLPIHLPIVMFGDEGADHVNKYNNFYVLFMCMVPAAAVVIAARLKLRKIGEKNYLYTIAFSIILSIMIMGIVIYGLYVQTAQLNSLERNFDYMRLISLFICGAFSLMGVFLPDLRYNEFLGIRNKKTMAEPEVWVRVHKGIWVVMSLGFYILGVAVSLIHTWISLVVTLGGVTAFFTGCYVYSLYTYAKYMHEQEDMKAVLEKNAGA